MLPPGPSPSGQPWSVPPSGASTTARSPPPWRRPFAHLNLYRNPFGELTPQERSAAAVVDLENTVGWLGGERRALQFLGDAGRGKTTHLLALVAHFPAAAYVYLPEAGPRPTIPRGQPLMIDEAQRLPPWSRHRIFRRGDPLVLATHRDLEPKLRRAGYAVRSVQVSIRADAQRLQRILTARIEASRRGAGRVPEVSRQVAERLVERFGDDVRAMEGFLYEVFQQAEKQREQVRLDDRIG